MGLAYLINKNWRLLQAAYTAPALLFLAYWWIAPESGEGYHYIAYSLIAPESGEGYYCQPYKWRLLLSSLLVDSS